MKPRSTAISAMRFLRQAADSAEESFTAVSKDPASKDSQFLTTVSHLPIIRQTIGVLLIVRHPYFFLSKEFTLSNC